MVKHRRFCGKQCGKLSSLALGDFEYRIRVQCDIGCSNPARLVGESLGCFEFCFRDPNELSSLVQQALRRELNTTAHRPLDGKDVRNLDDIRSYVASRCAGAALTRVLEKAGRSTSDIAALLSGARQSGGKFLYAVRVLNDLVVRSVNTVTN